MIQISVEKKTGFDVVNPNQPVEILDAEKRFFYDTSEILPVKKFNLPKGTYYLVRGEIKKRAFPVSYSLYILPLGQRFTHPDPKNFSVIVSPEPDKCKVHWNDRFFVVDPSITSMPDWLQDFIFFHELGHEHYSTEKYCDLYAANCMLRKGYTPFQVMLASGLGLSGQQTERKSFIKNKILQANGQDAN